MTTSFRCRISAAAFALLLANCTSLADEPAPLVVQGSSMVGRAMQLAAPLIREELQIRYTVLTEGGSSGGIAAAGSKSAALGMSTRRLTGVDRSDFPAARLMEFQIGMQVMALIVPIDVWQGGVRSITQKQMLAIYETDIRNWKELGGPDRPIKFYNTEEGRGPWEMLAHWLYGDVRKAPLGKFERVGSSEETRNLVEFNAGSLAVVPLKWADGKSVFPLALIGDNGEVIAPTPENLASDKYPLSRPLLLISGERPTGPARKILQFMYGEGGKKALRDADFVPQEEIAPVTPP